MAAHSEAAVSTGVGQQEKIDIRQSITGTSFSQETADDALRYLHGHGGEAGFAHDQRCMKRLTCKIDCFVMPFLILPFLMNYLDKVLLNVRLLLSLARHP